MEIKTFIVPNIGCDGCVKSIKNELSQVAGIKSVEGVAATKTVTVQWTDPASWTAIVETLRKIDYAPAEA